MATLFSHPFTAADATAWNDIAVAFDKVYGSTSLAALIATISSNKGVGPATANEAIYRSMYQDALRDYKVSLDMDWNNAAASGRAAGPGVRVSADGQDGYFAVLDSNLGACRIKVVRRKGGTFTALGVGWVTTSEGAAALNAGVTVTLRVQNQDDGVHLKASVGTNVYFDIVDPYVAGVSIDDGGTAGIYIDGNCATTDITFDNLVSKDFEDEATSGTGYQSGIGLVINGVYYNETEWMAAGLDPQVARVSYAPSSVASISDLNPPGSPFLRVGDWVKILYDNVALAEGLVQMAKQTWAPAGGIAYDLVGPRQLGEEALIEDPINGAPFLSFNFEEDSEFYDADRSDMTVGDILAFVYDNATTGVGGLRAVKAAPASGDVYVLAELAALDATIPALSLSGNVLQVEETLLSFMPEYAIYVDPATRIRHIHKRSTAPIRVIKTSEGHNIPELTRDTSKNWTRIKIYGTAPEAEEQTFDYIPAGVSTMSALWPSTVEAAWSPDKAKTAMGTFTVLSAGTEGAGPNIGHVYLIVDVTPSGTPMDENEWAGTLLVMVTGADSGSTYKVRANTAGGKIWLVPLVFALGTPTAGDIGTLSGVDDPGFSRNGHDAAFKEFDLGGVVGKGTCPQATIKNTVGTKTYETKVKAKYIPLANGDGTNRTGIRLDLPAIGLINNLGTLCGETGGGGAVSADEVSITIPVENTPKAVPSLTVPASGYRGTAYSFNPALWDGGGEPSIGDPGRKRTLALNFPDFQNVSLQGAEYTKMADAMLAVLGTLSESGTFQINDAIDTSYVGLNERFQFVDDGDSGTDSQVTGYEASENLWVLQVEFNLREEAQTVYIGTLSAQGVDLDAYRKRYAERTRLEALKRYRKLAQEMRDCLKNAFNGAGAAGDNGATTQPGCNVTSDIPGMSMLDRVGNISIDIDTWIDDVLDALGSVFEFNKGFTFARDDDNNITVYDAAGAAIGTVSPGGGYTPTGVVPRVGGVEGGILSNLGKTVDGDGNVLAPGSAVPAGGARHYPFGGGAPTLLSPGDTVPGTLTSLLIAEKAAGFGWTVNANGTITDAGGNAWRPLNDGTFVPAAGGSAGIPQIGGPLGGLLHNAGKAISATGDVYRPGDSVADLLGADHYNFDVTAAPTNLPLGALVPGNLTSTVFAEKRTFGGLVINDDCTITDVRAEDWNTNYLGEFRRVSDNSVGTPALGGALGGLLHNAEKTVAQADGAVLEPGTTVPTGGALVYEADGSFTDLTAGATVPDSLATKVAVLVAAAGSPGPGAFVKRSVLTSGTTFTTQAGVTRIRVVAQAGGGGGGGGAGGTPTFDAFGGGGSAGGRGERDFTVAPSTGYTYAVGAAGAAGSSAGGTGGTGGDSTFTVGAVTMTAKGGPGGVGDAAGASAATFPGGAATAVTTSSNVPGAGAPGGPGLRFGGGVGMSGNGGSCVTGAGGEGQNSDGAGVTGKGYGSGGGGACVTNGNPGQAGGAGAQGVIIVDEYVS